MGHMQTSLKINENIHAYPTCMPAYPTRDDDENVRDKWIVSINS